MFSFFFPIAACLAFLRARIRSTNFLPSLVLPSYILAFFFLLSNACFPIASDGKDTPPAPTEFAAASSHIASYSLNVLLIFFYLAQFLQMHLLIFCHQIF